MIHQIVRTLGVIGWIATGAAAWADHHDKSIVIPGVVVGARASSNVQAETRAATTDHAEGKRMFKADDRPERKVRVVYPAPRQ